MKKIFKKAAAAALTAFMLQNMGIAAFGSIGEKGGTWAGYDTYDAWCDAVGEEKLPSADEGVGSITELWWNGSTAVWDFAGNCTSFETALYRNNELVKVVQADKTSYDFSSALNEESGNYTFQVRSAFQDQYSQWSDMSDLYFSRLDEPSHIHNSGVRAARYEGPAPGISEGTWESDGEGQWRYIHKEGCYTTNGWEYIDTRWYFFNYMGYRHCGWLNWNGASYYLDRNGAMVTGRKLIDGKVYVFDVNGPFMYIIE